MGYGVLGIGYDSKLVVVRHEGVGVLLSRVEERR